MLASEVVLRDERRTTTLMKLATMPAVKTLEQFDRSCAGGAPKAQIQALVHHRIGDGVLVFCSYGQASSQ